MINGIYTLDEIKQKVKPIAQRYGIEKAYLFGSYARGEATAKSDLDFLIEKGRLRGLFQLSGLHLDLEEAFNCEVDVITTTSSNQQFISNIRKDEILLYEES